MPAAWAAATTASLALAAATARRRTPVQGAQTPIRRQYRERAHMHLRPRSRQRPQSDGPRPTAARLRTYCSYACARIADCVHTTGHVQLRVEHQQRGSANQVTERSRGCGEGRVCIRSASQPRRQSNCCAPGSSAIAPSRIKAKPYLVTCNATRPPTSGWGHCAPDCGAPRTATSKRDSRAAAFPACCSAMTRAQTAAVGAGSASERISGTTAAGATGDSDAASAGAGDGAASLGTSGIGASASSAPSPSCVRVLTTRGGGAVAHPSALQQHTSSSSRPSTSNSRSAMGASTRLLNQLTARVKTDGACGPQPPDAHEADGARARTHARSAARTHAALRARTTAGSWAGAACARGGRRCTAGSGARRVAHLGLRLTND